VVGGRAAPSVGEGVDADLERGGGARAGGRPPARVARARRGRASRAANAGGGAA